MAHRDTQLYLQVQVAPADRPSLSLAERALQQPNEQEPPTARPRPALIVSGNCSQMRSSVASSYTPPPPQTPSEAYRAAQTIEYPATATPLPPSPSIPNPVVAIASSRASSAHPSSQSPQIRYCYFISAASAASASAAPSRSQNLSVSSKPIYLAPHVQEPMHTSPNSTQPRTRSVKDAPKSSSSVFILGPHPPQIQLQFLEDEPLPTPAPSEPSALADAATSHDGVVQKIQSSDIVLVERKDSGYGGSVSRSSSLAAFSRGIRRVFWRNTQKGSVGSIVLTDPPVLDCGIPQDVLDHEGWAQDLAERLTLASAPDSVAAWLGQLPAEVALVSEEMDASLLNETEDGSSGYVQDMVKEMIFLVPQLDGGAGATLVLPTSKSESSLDMTQEQPAPFDANPTLMPSSIGKSLRRVLSIEQLNKPQPPLPLEAVENKPVPSLPDQAKRASSSTSPFGSIARKLTAAGDVALGKSFPTKLAPPGRRPNIQEIFQESASEPVLLVSARQSREGRGSGVIMEQLLDNSSLDPLSTKIELQLTTKTTSNRSKRFFQSLTTTSAMEFRDGHAQKTEARPLSEVLLSNSNLSPEEISAEIASASCSSSLRSPAPQRATIPRWHGDGSLMSSGLPISKERSSSFSLAPPKPFFYNKGVASSVSSLGEVSSCGSIESSVADSSADEWDGLTRMAQHAREQNARYTADLKDLQALLYEADGNHLHYTPTHSASTSTGSLILPSVPSSPNTKEKPSKAFSKKDDYMSHRMSGCSPKLLPVAGKAKPRSKSRLSMTYGGGELEVVKHAKIDTPEAVARNKEIRKFISQEIYTTELNYLQYLRTIQEVFVGPLLRSHETDKPFIPKSNALYQLLAHISALIDVSSQVVQRLQGCVRDEIWSHEASLVGTIFLDVKEPLSVFLKYGQSYGKGMKALRTLMKSKRASVSVTPGLKLSPGPGLDDSGTEGACMDKRRSLPSIFSLNSAPGAPSSILLDSSWSGSSAGSCQANVASGKPLPKPRSSHEMIATGDISEFDRFLYYCAGDKETTSRFSLADLLILPIQRVTRYCLLLKDLKRHTDVAHPDYVCIVHALEQLHTLALATNNVQPSSMRT